MVHNNTVLNQILKFFPRHEFDALAKEHHVGRDFRSFSRWHQFAALLVLQLTGRQSLRDLVDNFAVQSHKLYHLGCRVVSRSTLARVNEKQPADLYKHLFSKLLARLKGGAPQSRFAYKGFNKLYLLDSTLVALSLKVFPWAVFRRARGALKLHVGLDACGYLPDFVSFAEGKSHELNWAKNLSLPLGSMVVFDRGFTDYGWYNELTESGVFFITRLKNNAAVESLGRRPGRKKAGVLCDEKIALRNVSYQLRRIRYRAPDGREYVFVTNNHHLEALTVAEIYKERWQIELFFKWIKQNLKIKKFLGTSLNAVMTQIWVAMCAYLVLSWLAFQSKDGSRIRQKLLRLIQLCLFERRDLWELLKPPKIIPKPAYSLF